MWHFSPSEDLKRFREYALEALQQARGYLLDHLAADYIDSLHDQVAEKASDTNVPAMTIHGEVTLPTEVASVEFNDRELGGARFERASKIAQYDDKPTGIGRASASFGPSAADTAPKHHYGNFTGQYTL